ncbi:MAG: 2-C-methyl-D-erythritol 2,4-cyclodiphosphate synthase [Bacteroidia bacterium]|nr:2-C-methyl-D-erythritol 2,4-cyclodiphosphate synthase [Bacteroidia bacterium]
MPFRIGFGFDVHKLAEGESFILGGVNILHTKGTIAFSDGDALIHAVCDALLGAAGLRDIGFHFPDTNQEYKGIDSKILLEKVYKLIRSKRYSVINIDSTICLQQPKISSYIPEMQHTLANILNIELYQISIKATTTERLGFIGREEGLAVYAVVLIEQKM